MRLAFDVYNSLSQALWKKAQHDSGFSLPLPHAIGLIDNIVSVDLLQLLCFCEISICS